MILRFGTELDDLLFALPPCGLRVADLVEL